MTEFYDELIETILSAKLPVVIPLDRDFDTVRGNLRYRLVMGRGCWIQFSRVPGTNEMVVSKRKDCSHDLRYRRRHSD